MVRNFYPLDQAAKKLGMTVDDLIHAAAWNIRDERISVYILTAHFDRSLIHVDKDGAFDEYPSTSFSRKLEKLSPGCLQEFEAAGYDAEVSFDREPFYDWDLSDAGLDDPLGFLFKPAPRNGYWLRGVRRRNAVYPLLYELRPRRLFDSTYPEPIKIRECKMVVLAEDLERLQQMRAETADNSGVPSGHQERHAKNREEVLGGALAVLATWPEKCRFKNGKINAAAIATLVDVKSPLIWPVTGEPPLKKDKITRLVSDCISKINE